MKAIFDGWLQRIKGLTGFSGEKMSINVVVILSFTLAEVLKEKEEILLVIGAWSASKAFSEYNFGATDFNNCNCVSFCNTYKYRNNWNN